MPFFRDVQGALYNIPQESLDRFRVSDLPQDAKISGGEIGPGLPGSFPGGYFWDPRPGGYFWDPRPGGYHWGGGYRW
jgi:hypothetical protein